MSAQMAFFKKSLADLTQPNLVVTASQGQDTAEFALNRRNTSAWITTDSVDADNTTYEVDFTDEVYISDILLIKHNFKNFTIKRWNGSTFVDFSTPIAVSNNTEETNWYRFDRVSTQKVQITITGTQVANEDKIMYQFIATELMGQLTGWPKMKDPRISKNRKTARMLSGKLSVTENVGYYAGSFGVENWRIAPDIAIIESLYNSFESFLFWPCGGDEDQFFGSPIGYRLEDIYLCRTVNDYSPEYVAGIYANGLNLEVKLEEVTE